jgi:deoxyribodipyrimidine photolyase-related protein
VVKRQQVRNLIILLGDQLSRNVASLRNADRERDLICMCEVDEETTYVAHHKQKLIFILSAMRHFAEELRHDGFRVDYTKLNSADNPGSLEAAAAKALKSYRPERLIVTEAGEWRVQQKLEHLRNTADAEIAIRQDDRFLCSHTEFADWAKGRKSLRLEYFYRQMRRQTGFLMENENPAGGQWNFDKNNRKPLASAAKVPEPIAFQPDSITEQVIELVRERFAENFGDIGGFRFATTRDEAIEALDYFIDRCLDKFGDYQDAMMSGHATLFHSILSGYINIGLLDPREVCERVVQAYEAGDIPLNSAEGFIRQIIGWREFVRGIYWLKMPAYLDENYFNVSRDLPAFYWTGDTHMRYMKEAIKQTQETSYAHHIQRLMITGNFALLAGIDPRQVHEWYMAV